MEIRDWNRAAVLFRFYGSITTVVYLKYLRRGVFVSLVSASSIFESRSARTGSSCASLISSTPFIPFGLNRI